MVPHVTDTSVLNQFSQFAAAIDLDLSIALPPEIDRMVKQADTENFLPSHLIVDALQISSQHKRHSDVGIRFAEWCNMRGFGPLCLVWDHCSNLSEAVHLNAKYMHLENQALGVELVKQGNDIALVHSLMVSSASGGGQFMEATLLSFIRMAKMLLGDDWKPLRIQLQGQAPDNAHLRRALLGAPLEYECEDFAIIVSAEDLRKPALNSNPRMLEFLKKQLETAAVGKPQDFRGQVAQAISTSLAGGGAHLSDVSGRLGVSSRTLQRRLADSGDDFASVLDDVRIRKIDEYFKAAPNPTQAQLTYILGYAEASTASRFLKQRFGRSFREMQAQARVGF